MFVFVNNFVQILYSLKLTKTFYISTINIIDTMANKYLQRKHQFNCCILKIFLLLINILSQDNYFYKLFTASRRKLRK